MNGRPTKLTDATWKKVDKYLKDYGGDKVPTAAGLSVYLGVSKSTIYLWAQNDQRFSDTLGKINALQESLLINHSLVGEFNSTIAKLMLSNHGYSEKSQHEVTGADGGPIKTEVTHDLSKLSTEELRKLDEILSKA